MKQLAALTQFIVDQNLVAAENVDAWVENPRIVPSGTVKSHNSVVICRQTYSGVIFIENFPHRRTPPELLFALISAWLIEHDGERFDRKDAELTTNVEIMDSETADIDIGIEFSEEIDMVEWPGGPIELNGKRYQLRQLLLNYAETGEVVT